MNMDEQLKKCIVKLQKKRNDEKAANLLVSHYYNEIYCYMYKQTIDKELSMDLTQEIFIRMLQSIQSYDESKAGFRTWLYKIATNQLVDYYRSKTFRNIQLSQAMEEDIEDESDFTLDVERRAQLEQIIECVNQLDVTRQKIFRLKIFGEYSFLEIGRMMELPESTVKTKFYATQKMIRTQVQGGS